jgi:hypothetical protein
MSEDAAAVVDRKKQLIEWEHHLVRECWRQGFQNNDSVPVIETTIRKILLEDPVQKEDDVKKKEQQIFYELWDAYFFGPSNTVSCILERHGISEEQYGFQLYFAFMKAGFRFWFANQEKMAEFVKSTMETGKYHWATFAGDEETEKEFQQPSTTATSSNKN